MTIDTAKDYLREHWPNIRAQLLEGTYQPQPVKRVEIPKPPCLVWALSEQRQVVCVGRSTRRPKRRLGREGAPLGQRGGAPPDAVARAYLKVIGRNPSAVSEANSRRGFIFRSALCAIGNRDEPYPIVRRELI